MERIFDGGARQLGISKIYRLDRLQRALADNRIKALASKYGRAPAQILFRYLTWQDVCL
jgi:diketogulonate reductase-like aldo/keto reductase